MSPKKKKKNAKSSKKASTKANFPISRLQAIDPQTGEANAVVETPKGYRIKYKYDPGLGIFKLHKVLPTGFVYPYDFGFLPSTLGEDGDPVDILILVDEPTFTGCVVPVHLVGVIEAEQTEKKETVREETVRNETVRNETVRNDRLIGVASASLLANEIKDLTKMDEQLLEELEQFFISYERIEGKEFKPVGRFGPDRARKLVDAGVAAFLRANKG